MPATCSVAGLQSHGSSYHWEILPALIYNLTRRLRPSSPTLHFLIFFMYLLVGIFCFLHMLSLLSLLLVSATQLDWSCSYSHTNLQYFTDTFQKCGGIIESKICSRNKDFWSERLTDIFKWFEILMRDRGIVNVESFTSCGRRDKDRLSKY
jgi:hypothetical protein